jgi:hypothetical protein
MSKMRKKIVLKGALVGAGVGCVTATLYLWVMTAVGYSTTPPSILEQFRFALWCSTFTVLPSVLIGALTGSVFGFLFLKFRIRKKLYIAVCTLFCALTVASSLAVILALNWKNFHLDQIDIFPAPDSGSLLYGIFLGVCVVPGILYCLISLFVSAYLFDQFKQIELSYQVLPEENVIPTSA